MFLGFALITFNSQKTVFVRIWTMFGKIFDMDLNQIKWLAKTFLSLPKIFYHYKIFINKSNLSYNLNFSESSESSSSDDNSSSDNSSDDDSDNDSEANEKTPAKNPDLKDLGLDWGSDDSS